MNLFDKVCKQADEFERIYLSDITEDMKEFALMSHFSEYEDLYSLCGADVEDWDWPEDEELYLLEGISAEKGTFFETTIQLDEPIDVTKFKFNVQETYNEEDIVVGLVYNGEELDNDGGSTNGKGYYFTLHDCC